MADDTNNSPKRERTPRKADLPSTAPEGSKRVVVALAELAGPATRERVAGRLNAALGGRLAQAIAAALSYGFIAVDGDGKLVVTERGVAFIGEDEDASKAAQRQAVMGTGFGAVINRLSTHKADPEVVAVRLQEDQGLGEAPAIERAKVLVKAAAAAELIVNERFDAAAIEDTIAIVGEPVAPDAGPKPQTSAKPDAAATAKLKPPVVKPAVGVNAARAASKEGRTQKEPDAPFEHAAGPLEVVLHIDASKLSAKEIGEIVRELRASATVSTSGS